MDSNVPTQESFNKDESESPYLRARAPSFLWVVVGVGAYKIRLEFLSGSASAYSIRLLSPVPPLTPTGALPITMTYDERIPLRRGALFG